MGKKKPSVPESMLNLLPPLEDLMEVVPPSGHELYFIRHAAPFDVTRERRQTVYGSHAPGVRLSEVGILQAQEARNLWGNQCPRPALVVSSPLVRARDTAEIIIMENYEVLPPPFELDRRLEDNRLGVRWLNIPRKFWTENREKLWRLQLESDGSHGQPENPYQAQERGVTSLFEHTGRFPGEPIVFVSHGDIICFIMQYLLGEPIMNLVSYHNIRAVDKCTIWRVRLRPAKPVEVECVFSPSREQLLYVSESP